MAVEAVASVVIRKLTDMLTEETIMHHKVIVEQLEEIKKILESMGGFLIDAEDKQKTDPQVKEWAEKCLRHLYDVEDTIETFALRFARQRKRLGFLMNHAMFLKNFKACRILSRKINKIRGQIKKLDLKKPDGVEDASVNSRSIRSLSIELGTALSTSNAEIMNGGVADQIEDKDKDAVETQTEDFSVSEQVLCNHHHHHHLNSNEMLMHTASANSEVLTADTNDNASKRLSPQPLRTLSDASVSADRFGQSTQANWENPDIIALSYNDLPVHLKLCLLYMVLFPKDYDIPVRRLQRLWLAEGFVKRPDESSSSETSFQEDLVKQYFGDLVKRSLIQVSKLTSDGSPKRCRVLGVIHDHLVPKAEAISLFHVHRRSDSCEVAGPFGARRLVQYTDLKKWDPSQLRCLRSYLSFNSQYKDTPAKEVGNLLHDMIGNGLQLLRVLDLEGVYKPCLPENLGDFFHLRYLGLRWTFLDALPESVGQLHYLEALDIKHTYINSLPTFIWKLKHLTHLSANGIPLDLPSWHSWSSLPQLLTLWGFSIDDESLLKDGLKSLVHLRELGISFHLNNSEGLLDWISNLTAIQTLRLRSKDDMGRPSKLILKPLLNLKQLTHLNLLGNLPELPENGDFPQELKVLTLSVSHLRADPMPILGKLPKLTVLRLLAESYLEKTMRCPQGGFKELRVLKLWMLKNLEQWDVEEGAMERLKELNIRCCDRLRMIPCRLLRQRTFKELTLTNMPVEFRKQVEMTKGPHVSLTPPKDYKFSPLPWEGAEDSLDGVNSRLSYRNGLMKN